MQKEANLTRNMNSQEKGQRSTSNIDLGQYRSSRELLRVFQIKREKVLKNIGGSNPPMTEAKGEGKGKLPNTKQVNSQAKAVAQFKLSDFAAADQRILDSTRELGTTKKISDSSSNTQPNIPTQSKTTTEGSRDRQQLLKATIAGNDISMQKHQQKKRAISENHTSREKEQPKKRMVEYDTSRDIQQLKKTSAGNNLSKQKHQEKTRVISENHTSREKEQSKKTMVEYDGSRDIQQVRKTSAGNDLSKQKHQEKRRVISENHTSSEKEQPKKRISLCRSMTIDEFLKEKGEVNEELENESDDEEYDPMEEEEEEEEEEDEEEEEEEVGNFEINGNEIEGTRKKRTRGPTRCLKIHARTSEDRQEVTLDEDGEPIGPNDKTVSDLSYFLGTLARNAEFCPLIYTNFKALLNDRKDRLWKYVNDKYIISDRGQKAVFSRINDAWRSHKSKIKKKHFLKYNSMKERLQHHPKNIPSSHFKKLLAFWTNETIQAISKKNAANRAKQKYMHRVGPVNFARIRAKLRAKKEDGEEVTQAEMFIYTRKSKKGKKVDDQTQNAIDILEESIETSSEDAKKAFRSLLGKEKSGRTRCHGRTMTPSLMKKNEEIASVKKQYSSKITALERKMQAYDALLKSVLMQQNPNLSEEVVNNLMQSAFENNHSDVPHNIVNNLALSSTSINAPLEKDGNDFEDPRDDFEDPRDDFEE